MSSTRSRDIIVIGASTGGIEALKILVAGLPATLPATIFVVVHVGAYGLDVLDRILQEAGSLPASTARDRQPFERGHIYVAPGDHHLLLDGTGCTRVSRGPKENRTRPAVDPLFRSAAHAFGSRVIGVVLTGWLDDGMAGLWAIKERGGTAIVQDPQEALAPSMPANALRHVAVDHCASLTEIAALLVRLTTTGMNDEQGVLPPSKLMETEVRIALEDNALDRGIMEWGEPSVFACPECHGVLMQLKEGSNVRFRCHTGHAYSLETLLADFTEQTEDTLWSAIRSIEETVLLLDRMATHLGAHSHPEAASSLREKARQAQGRADLVRRAVMTPEQLPRSPSPSVSNA